MKMVENAAYSFEGSKPERGAEPEFGDDVEQKNDTKRTSESLQTSDFSRAPTHAHGIEVGGEVLFLFQGPGTGT